MLGVLIALPVLAAGPSVTKSVLGSDNGTSVVLLRVKASNQAVYGVVVKDASGSISDIVAPKGWVGITSGSDVLFRTGSKPIRAGSSLSFRLFTTNEDGALTVHFKDEQSPIGSGKTL
jgi:hypothetical protein